MSESHIPAEYVPVSPAQPTQLMENYLPTLHKAEQEIRRYQWIGKKGDLIAFLSQIRLHGKDEPALILANARVPRERQVWIPLSHLWRTLDPEALKVGIPQLASVLYGHVTRFDMHRVFDALFDFAEDLVHAPTPNWLSNEEWERAIQVDGFDITARVLNS